MFIGLPNFTLSTGVLELKSYSLKRISKATRTVKIEFKSPNSPTNKCMKASANSNEKNQQKIVYLDGFQKPVHRATSGFLKHFHDCTGCSFGKSAKITQCFRWNI